MSSLAPIDYNAIRVALVAFIRMATGLDENHVTTMEPETSYEPRPTNPYVAFKITSAAIRYGDDVPSAQPGGGVSYGGPRGMAISLNTYGRSHEEAAGLMACLQVAADMPIYRDILVAAGVAPWRTGAINDLSMLLNTGYEGRMQMDLFCGIAFNTAVVTQDIITKVTVVGTADTGAGQKTTITITGGS